MYRTIQLFIIVVVLMLSACSPYKPTNYTDEISDLNSEQVVELYFDAWNKKEYGKMYATLSDEMKAITIDYEGIDSIGIISSKQVEKSKLPKVITDEFTHETSDMLENLQDIRIYRLEISYELRLNNNSTENKNCILLVYVGKETSESPWLIYYEQKVDKGEF